MYEEVPLRIKNRKNKIWSQNYIIHYFLWKDVEKTVSQILSGYSNKIKILDVGCGNKPYEDLFEKHEYIGLDTENSNTKADIIGSAMEIPFEDNLFDLVFTSQVLEHVSNPKKMIEECYRVLKTNGRLVLTAPFVWPLHEDPYDFHRFTKYGLECMYSDTGFRQIFIKTNGGNLAQICQSICLQIPSKLRLLRIPLNLIGSRLDKFFKNDNFCINYLSIATK